MAKLSDWLTGVLLGARDRLRNDGGIAAVGALLGVGLRGVLDPLLEWREPYLPSIAAVALIALHRDAWAAALTAVFGTLLATLMFVVPRGGPALLTSSGVVGALTAGMACAAVIVTVRHLRRRVDELADQNRLLVQRQDEHDRFLAQASHELRSPLGAVRWAVAMLEGAGRDEMVVARAVGILQRQMRQLGRLVDDLVVLCSSTLGRLVIERRDADLRGCVQAAVEANQMALRARQQRLALGLPRDAVAVHVDEGRITQALSNLLHNASKFSPAGAVIALEVVEAGPWVHLVVRDGGPGFGKTDAAQQGLGIGLQLSRMLVELHGGLLQVDERGDPGAVVRLSLPRLLPSALPAPASQPMAAS